jgi:hypothetical protein
VGYCADVNRQHVVTTVVALVALSGCSSGHDDGATRVAEQLYAGLRARDGLAACAALSEDAEQQLVESEDAPCGAAILELDLPVAGAVRDVQVYGTAAQVRFGDDVLFLGEFPDGWKVTAAGCTEETHAPYDCQIQGG